MPSVVAAQNWTAETVLSTDGKATDQVRIICWMTEAKAKDIQFARVAAKTTTTTAAPAAEAEVKTSSHGKGVDGKRDIYHRHDFVVKRSAIKATEGTGGWATTISNGKNQVILTLGILNRQQNPKWPIQSPEEIAAIFGSAGADSGKKKKAKPAAQQRTAEEQEEDARTVEEE